MERDDLGCLGQRSQLDRLRDVADRWTRDRLHALATDPEALAITLIVLGSGGQEVAQPLGPLAQGEAVLKLIPSHAIWRALRDHDASAAALVSLIPDEAVAMQISDSEHEQNLIAKIAQTPADGLALGKWDFGRVRWPVRLRGMLGAARMAAEMPMIAGKSARLATVSPETGKRLRQEAGGQARREHVRQLREQLHGQSAPAPSWLH